MMILVAKLHTYTIRDEATLDITTWAEPLPPQDEQAERKERERKKRKKSHDVATDDGIAGRPTFHAYITETRSRLGCRTRSRRKYPDTCTILGTRQMRICIHTILAMSI